MPYRIRWEGRGVYKQFFGLLSPAYVKDAYNEVTDDPRYEHVRYVLSDYLEARPNAGGLEPDVAEFAELERHRLYSSPDLVSATVATDPQILGHIRLFEGLQVSPYPIGIFPTVADARKWIASNPRFRRVRAFARATAEAQRAPA
jgi:hypothetical protein